MDEEGTHSPPGRPERLGLLTKIAYGTGHILNDMCASMWFTYLLIYFHSVLRFDNVLAGIIMLRWDQYPVCGLLHGLRR